MTEEDGFEVRVTFKVKATIKDIPLEQWRNEMEWEPYFVEGDPPRPEDGPDYLDVAKFVAKEWNATGDYYEYIDAADTEWETVALKETAQIAETCTHEGCGRTKSNPVHRVLHVNAVKGSHEFTTEKQKEKCVREYMPGRQCGLFEDDIVHTWPLGGGGEHFFVPPGEAEKKIPKRGLIQCAYEGCGRPAWSVIHNMNIDGSHEFKQKIERLEQNKDVIERLRGDGKA